MSDRIRVLLIEDDPQDADLVRKALADAEAHSPTIPTFDLLCADRLSTGLERLSAGDVDAVLLDLSLRDSRGLQGLDVLCKVHAQAQGIPVIVLTGRDEALALEAIRQGAQDYVTAERIARGHGELACAIRCAVERLAAGQAAREEGARFRSLIANIPDVVWTTDSKGRTTFISPNVEQVYGYTPQEIYRAGDELWLKRIHPRDAGPVRGAYESLFARNVMFDIEYRIRHKDGHWIWLHDRAIATHEKGGAMYADGVFSDVTARVQAEGALRKAHDELEERVEERTAELVEINASLRAEIAERIRAEQELEEERDFTKAALDAQKDTFFVFDPANGRAIRWNRAFGAVSGYSDREIDAMRVPDSFYSDADLAKAATAIQNILREGHTTVEMSLITKGGETIPTEYSAAAIADSEGNPKYIIAIGRDITALKQAEEVLRASENRLRSLIENTTDAVFCYEYDPPIPTDLPTAEQVGRFYQGVLAECNDICARSYGATRAEEVIGRRLTELFGTAPGSLDGFFRAFIENGYRTIDAEGVEVLPDGTERHFLNNGHGIVQDGVLLRVWGTYRDITERVRAESQRDAMLKALRESEMRFRALSDATFEGIAFTEQGVLIDANQQFADMLAYEMDQISGMDVRELVAPEDQELVRNKMLAGSQEPYEHRALCKDGTIIHVEVRPRMMNVEGRLVRVTAVRDITALKQAEEVLRRHTDRLEVLHEIDQGILTARSPEAIAQAAVRGVRQWIPCLRASVTLFDYVAKAAVVLAFDMDVEVKLEKGVHLPLDHFEDVGKAAQQGDVVRWGDLLSRGSTMEALYAAGIRSFISIPLVAGGELVGALSLGMGDPATLAPEHEVVACQVANQLAIAIQQARLLAQVQEQAQQMQQIMDTVPEGVLLLDAEHRVVLANPVAQRDMITLGDAGIGDTLVSLGERPLSDLLTWPDDRSWHEIVANGHAFEIIARPVQVVPASAGWVLVIRDMTRERDMQARARQQDRLAVIGQLAGGVAHDFNNLLTAIQGFTGLVLGELGPGDPIRTDLEEVLDAANRAAALTNQLLTFSRKQVSRPQVLDLNAVIANIERMLRRLIGENIELNTVLDSSLGRIKADPGQVEQVIMNLSVNARDAMSQGGYLALETANVVLDRAYARTHPGVEPGRYVMLAVSDTGIGMTEEVKAHLFEPFFTTKAEGKGTGLGLATVHGIVTQSGGHIEVYSELGMGTTFKVYLPQVEPGTESAPERASSKTLSRGTETILLVEDDDLVRELARRILVRQGYTVIVAPLPGEAQRLSQECDGPISLLVTDVVMPEMGGRDLAQRLALSRPEIKILYISGYTDDAIAHHGVLEPGVALLEKPFTPAALVRKVREVLDESPSG